MVGSVISHYKIVSELGRGGMGIVYKAEDTKLDRTVAIKVLPSAALASEDDRTRFYREAKAAAQLHHPNIAVVHEIDEAVPSGAPHGTEPSPFIAMEFIEGESLHDRIQKGPLKLEEAVRLASQIASGLEAAHEKDIVHRDIKSGNVMLTAKGYAKILDFGLAQTMQSTKLTRMGSTLGTVAYMSPEQARGEEVDRRTDIWSLGVVLYEMIAGRHPFPGEYEQAVVYEILNQNPEPLTSLRTGVPMALEWVVNKMLAKTADERYQSTAEILVDLKAVDLTVAGPTAASTATTTKVATRGRTSLSFPAVGAVALIVAALTALAMILVRSEPTPPPVKHLSLEVPQTGLREPALSPEGRFLTYSGLSPDGYTKRLYVYDFGSGSTISIPNVEAPGSMAFSQDGTTIAFISNSSLFTVSTTGGEPLFWADNAGRFISWSPDEELFFRRGDSIMRIEGARAEPVVFMEPDSSGGRHRLYPAGMLPDNSHLLVIDERGDGSDLYAINVKTRTVKLILEKEADDIHFAPSGHLVSTDVDAEQLLARPFDPETLDLLESSPSLVSSDLFWGKWTFSQNGVFAAVRQSNFEGYRLLQVDSANYSRSLSEQVVKFQSLSASPDARYLAADIYKDLGKSIQVVTYDTEAGIFTQLTHSGYNTYPAWSPDGNRIVFVSNRDGINRNSLYVRRASGDGEAERIWQSEGTIWSPNWSPDGDYVIFSDGSNGGAKLWMYSFETDSAKPFPENVTGLRNQMQARFSPNGRLIAYTSNETGRYEIWVITIDGYSKRMVTTSGGNSPVWSRAGTHLYYKLGNTIYGIPVETESDFQVLREAREVFMSEDLRFYDALADPGRFIVAESVAPVNMYFEIILNWFEVLKQKAPHPD